MANKNEKQKVRLAVKIVFFVGIFAVILNISLFAVLRYWVMPTVQNEIKNRLLAYSEVAANLIDGDVEQRILMNKLGEDSPEYLEVRDVLRKIMQASPQINGMYTMEETKDPNKVMFVVDVTEDGEGTTAAISEIYDVTDLPSLQRGFVEPSVDKQFYTDKWGTTLSSYAPIKNSKGVVVGLVGTDMSYDQVLAQEKGILNRFYIYIGVFLLVIMILAVLLARLIVKAVGGLNKSVMEISSEGATELLNDEGGDEMAELAKSINRLVVGLRKAKENSEALVEEKTKFLEEKLEELEKLNKLMVGREVIMYELKKELREKNEKA